MRRTTLTVATARMLAIIGLLLVIAQGTASGQDSTPEASPEPSPAATPDFFIEIDGLGVAPIVPQGAVANLDDVDPQQVALTRVVLEPGEFLERSNPHWGSSVLFVERGTICFQIESAGNASLSLIASQDLIGDPATPSPTPPDGCALPPADCIDTVDGCDLVALGLTDVIVHEGQSVVQSAAPLDIVHRGYTNVGAGPAVIWIAQVQTVTGESAPCGGGCP